MAKSVDVKEAYRRLSSLIHAAEAGNQIVITRHGTPAAVLLSAREYGEYMATLEEMADPGALRALREAQRDTKAGRIYTYEQVFGHPPHRVDRKNR